jgi:hypothetical protein
VRSLGPVPVLVFCCRWSRLHRVPLSASGTWTYPVIGEGYDQQAEIATAVHKAYGEARPVYAGPAFAGDSCVLGVSQPALRHVTNLGADGLFIEGRSAPAADALTVVSPPARHCWRGCSAGCAGTRKRPRWDTAAPVPLAGYPRAAGRCAVAV